MYRSLFAPELITTRGLSVARATSIDLRIELTNASLENGFTIPDVPMMDSPPLYAQTGIEGTLGYFLAAGYGDGHNDGIAHFRHADIAEVHPYILLYHLAWRGINGGRSQFQS